MRNIIFGLAILAASTTYGQTLTISNMKDPDTGRPSPWNGTHRLVADGDNAYKTTTTPVVTRPQLGWFPNQTGWLVLQWRQVTEPVYPRDFSVNATTRQVSINGLPWLPPTPSQIPYSKIGNPTFVFSP